MVWNSQLDFDQVTSGHLVFQKEFYRDAWCYGAPGICYALLCASKATSDKKLAEFLIETLRDSVKNAEGLFSPTICHGYMGICQILDGAEELIERNCFEAEKAEIVQRILGFYDKKNKYGFKSIEYDHETGANAAFDVCGFLEGSSGVALGLCSLEHGKNNVWRKSLLIV